MSDVTTPQATPDAAVGHDQQATTLQAVTSRYATVREAADELGVSTETIRRMIRAGRLRAERVHRPQGTAFLVEMPDATGQVAQDVTDATLAGRHNATPEPALPPALLAAEAWARGVVEPLTRTIAEQQQQLISMAEQVGRLSAERDVFGAERDVVRAELETLRASQAQQEARETAEPWWRGLWPWLIAIAALFSAGALLTLPR